MSKQANPTLIGSFVLGGAALIAAAVLIIASDSLFADRLRYVVYFDGSVSGLSVGSNVMFRGVPVGYVSDVEILADYNAMEFAVPVYVDLDSSIIKRIDNRRSDADELMEELIGAGLRASLDTESFITGQLYIELDFYPDSEPEYRDKMNDFREIPTIATGIQAVLMNAQELVSRLQNEVDIVELGQNLAGTLSGLNELANSSELRSTLAGADALINNRATQNIGVELNQTLGELRVAIASVNDLLTGLEKDIPGVAAALNETLLKAGNLLALAEENLDEDSDLNFRVNKTLREVENAARAIRVLGEYLEQNPNALLTGKPAANGQ